MFVFEVRESEVLKAEAYHHVVVYELAPKRAERCGLAVLPASIDAKVVSLIDHGADMGNAFRDVHHVVEFGHAQARRVELSHGVPSHRCRPRCVLQKCDIFIIPKI